MVYLSAGIQGLTSIVGTFFVKEHLNLSAEFLAALGFWVGLPWALKMPLGHLVDVLWSYKSWLVTLGAALIAASLLIMAELVQSPQAMSHIMSVNAWYVLAALLAPVGYVLQDAVADAMTTEAVPTVDEHGQPLPQQTIHALHVTMQTLGRVAFVGGTILVALMNLWVFQGVGRLPLAEKLQTYRQIYLMALIIPVISISGLMLARIMAQRRLRDLQASGLSLQEARSLLAPPALGTRPNWRLLGASLAFVCFSLVMGTSRWPYGQEIIFMGSAVIVGYLMHQLMAALTPESRQTLLGTALVIFCFRATPGAGPGVNWWSIDVLGFDQSFFSLLSLIGGGLALLGMIALRSRMAKHSILQLTLWLTLAGGVLALPQLAMSLGFHHWTAAHTGGVVDARFIAMVDTALESPLGQIAMIPLLTWIAQSAPAELKATYFAVMTSFANLALSASQLLTKYINQIFVITREVKDPQGLVLTAANYNDLSLLLVTALMLGLALPLVAIAVVKALGWKTA